MEYLDGFFKGFDEKLRRGSGAKEVENNDNDDGDVKQGMHDPRVEFMGSDGGLLDLDNFSGLKSILSGPAGGVVGYALTSWDEEKKQPIIGYVHAVFSFILRLLSHMYTTVSMLAEHQQTSRVTLDGTKPYTKPPLPVLLSNRHSWTSTPSLLEVDRDCSGGMDSSRLDRRAQVLNLDLLVIGEYPTLPVS